MDLSETDFDRQVETLVNPPTTWYDRDAFGDLTMNYVNSFNALNAYVEIAEPLDPNFSVDPASEIRRLGDVDYAITHAELYQVGGFTHVQGFKHPLTGQDILLAELHDWLDDNRDGSDGRLIGITNLTANAALGWPEQLETDRIVEVQDGGNIAFHLQAPEYLIEPATIAQLYQKYEHRQKTGLSSKLGWYLFTNYSEKYLAQIQEGERRHSHQPAILAAAGIRLLEHELEYGRKKNFRGLVVSTQGSGKTYVESMLAEAVAGFSDQKIIYVTSRANLVDQSMAEFRKFGNTLTLSRFDQEEKEIDGQVIVTTFTSLPTLLTKLEQKHIPVICGILDESHNAEQARKPILKHPALAGAMLFAFTATPGYINNLDDLGFTQIIRIPLSYTIETKVTPPIAIKRVILGDAEKPAKSITDLIYRTKREYKHTVERKVDEYFTECVFDHDGALHIRPSGIQAKTIDECNEILKKVLKRFREDHHINMSQQIAIFHSEQSNEKNLEVVRRYNAGEVKTLIGVNKFSEGLNTPDMEVMIVKPWQQSEYRPFQDMGRAMRFHEKTGNACLIIEIWPDPNADNLGYRSALEILQVPEGDSRVAFRNPDQYARDIARLRHARYAKDTDSTAPLVFHFKRYLIDAQKPRRNRTLVGISEFSQLAGFILPRYEAYLRGHGEPITRVAFYQRPNALKVTVDSAKFEKIMDFRWSLIPFFRLDNREVQKLAQLLYDAEVRSGKRQDLKRLLNKKLFMDYVHSAVEAYIADGVWTRQNIADALNAAFIRDFNIKSLSYTVRRLAGKYTPPYPRVNDVTIPFFIDYLRLIHDVNNMPVDMKKLLPQASLLNISPEDFLNRTGANIRKRIETMVLELDKKMKGYVHSGGSIDSDVIYKYYGPELEAMEELVRRLRELTPAIRFKTDILEPSQRGRKLTTDFYFSIREQYPAMWGNITSVKNIVDILVKRLVLHDINVAEDVPHDDTDEFIQVFGITPGRLDYMLSSGTDLDWGQVVTRAARHIDHEYDRSYNLWSKNIHPEKLIAEIAKLLVAAEISPGKITEENLLLLQNKAGAYVLPRVYVELPHISKSDGRRRMALRNFIQSKTDLSGEDFMNQVRSEMRRLLPPEKTA